MVKRLDQQNKLVIDVNGNYKCPQVYTETMKEEREGEREGRREGGKET